MIAPDGVIAMLAYLLVPTFAGSVLVTIGSERERVRSMLAWSIPGGALVVAPYIGAMVLLAVNP